MLLDAGLILGDNLPVLFVGWEGVGLCSYLLIGFWYRDEANAAAGKKAFIANRIGDFGLLVAMGAAPLLHGRARLERHRRGQRARCSSAMQVWPIGTSPTIELDGAIVVGVPSCCSTRVDADGGHAGRPLRSSSAAPARARRSRSTSGCRTRWPAPRRSPRSSTPPRW